MRRQLVIMAKEPRLGRVKSRLAHDIGPVAALGFYRRMLARTAGRLSRDRRWQTLLAVTPDRAVFKDRSWPIRGIRMSQGGGGLGERMQRIMDVLPPGPVVIIGSDIPGIRPRMIEAAFRALGRHDAVFGPARDGGYWLVGLKRRPRIPRPFDYVRWSTEFALADTRANLTGANIALVDELDDVDDGQSHARFQAHG